MGDLLEGLVLRFRYEDVRVDGEADEKDDEYQKRVFLRRFLCANIIYFITLGSIDLEG